MGMSIVMQLPVTIFLVWGLFTQPSLSSSCYFQQLKLYPGNPSYVTNSGYPEFSEGQCEVWRYVGEAGTHIRISFIDLNIGSNCDGASLVIGSVKQKIYCKQHGTNEIPPPYVVTLNQASAEIYILFNSSYIPGRFKLKVEIALSADYEKTWSNADEMLRNLPDTMENWKQQGGGQQTACNFELTSPHGTIGSSKYLYSALSHGGQCSWLLRGDRHAGTVTSYRLFIRHCFLKRDELTIYQGNTDRIVKIRKFTGSYTLPFDLSVKSDVLITYKMNKDSLNPSQHGNFSIEFSKIVKCMLGYKPCGYDDATCYRSESYCDGIKDCPTSGEDEKDCPDLRPQVTTPAQRVITQRSVIRPVSHARIGDKNTCNFMIESSHGVVPFSRESFRYFENADKCFWQFYSPNPSKPYGTKMTIQYVFTFSSYCRLPGRLTIYEGNSTVNSKEGSYRYSCPMGDIRVTADSVLITYEPDNYEMSGVSFPSFNISFRRSVSCSRGYRSCGEGLGCYPKKKECDGHWDCSNGQDEKRCHGCGHEYSCNTTTPYCYGEADRCNGKGTCGNYMDEMNCTPQKCNHENGLFLCRNKRCIYEKWRCDRTRDCSDGSDEDECSSVPSPRVIVAAVVGATVFTLFLVIVFGCICKMCNVRVNHVVDTSHLESPLSRIQAELFRMRAPPPPYNEAMLTSRPYDEAYQELIRNREAWESVPQPQDRGERRRSRRHRSRQCRHQGSSVPAAPDGGNSNTTDDPQGVVESDAILARILQDMDATDRADTHIPPPYSMVDPRDAYTNHAYTNHPTSSGSSSDADSIEEGYLGRDDDVPMLDLGTPESSMDIEMTSTAVGGGDPQSSLSQELQDCPQTCSLLDFEEDEEEDDKADTASTSLSTDSDVALSTVTDKVEAILPSVKEDSDTECILDTDKADEEDQASDSDGDAGLETESDTACLIP